MSDLAKSKRAEQAKSARPGRLAAVASLGCRALRGVDLDLLMDEAVKTAAGVMGNEYSAVFELLPGGHELLVRAGVGLKEGVVGTARVGAGVDSQAGYTLVVDEPVIIEDLATEPRFTRPSLMVDHGVVSGVSVIVRGRDGPWGVLSSHTTKARRFSGEDVGFFQAIANVVAAAIERHGNDETRERADQQASLAAVGERAAGLAHDFNNIVTVIGFFAELLEADQDLDGTGLDQLSAIRGQVERAASLVWQVLDCAHRSPSERGPVDVASFLEELTPVLGRLRPTGVHIALHHDDGPHVVTADRAGLQQIFMNLASNANDAMDGRGELSITVSRLDVSASEPPPLDGMASGPWVRIDVADTGTGMPPEVLSRVFEPFFTTKLPARGTGVGLCQVLRLVGEHEGHVDIASHPQRGTTVSVWLPAACDEARPGPGPARLPAGTSLRQHVLVVDEDPAGRSSLGQVLEHLGYAVTAVADGEEAVSLLEDEGAGVDAVISDVMMPGLGGEGLARVLGRRHPAMPVILVSGYPLDRPAEPGPVLRMQKPFSSCQLAQALRAVLERRT